MEIEQRARHLGDLLRDDLRASRLGFNLLDTPGHEDFSEDTYRTLTAADSAVMVIDAAKGIEPQTRKLFEVCRLRDIPITTFINKLDREARDPLDLLDEISDSPCSSNALRWCSRCCCGISARPTPGPRRRHWRKRSIASLSFFVAAPLPPVLRPVSRASVRMQKLTRALEEGRQRHVCAQGAAAARDKFYSYSPLRSSGTSPNFLSI